MEEYEVKEEAEGTGRSDDPEKGAAAWALAENQRGNTWSNTYENQNGTITQMGSSAETGNEFQDPRYQGIGGWLLLVAFGLIITPVRLFITLINDYLPIFTQGAWKIILTKGNEAYSPFWAPLLFFEIIGNSFFAVFAIVIVVNLFRKKRSVPKLMIIYYLSNFALIVIDSVFAGFIPFLAQNDQTSTYTEIGRATVTCLIWVTYFVKSERVRGTFVR